jgi:hypothetical protein
MLIPSKWQTKVMNLPETMNLAMFGGRGVGRTTCALMMALSHAERYGKFARVLFIRQTLRSLKEVEDNFQMLLTSIYGGALRVNRQDHIMTLPNGATIEFGPLNDVEDMAKLQGRSFSLIIADEYGNFNPNQQKYVDQLRANLRAGDVAKGGAPTRMILLANPGGRAHQTIVSRFVAKMKPFFPHTLDDGQKWVLCPGNYTDNPNLPKNYDQSLFASAAKDKELFRAWSQGAWNIARGAMFADVIDESKHLITDADLPYLPKDGGPGRPQGLYGYLSCDWGQSAPAVCFAAWKILTPGFRYPRGSVILADEVNSADPEDLSVGTNWSVGRLAENIIDMCDRTGVYKAGVIDDAKGLQPDDTLIKGMARYSLNFQRPMKNRRSGWAAMRELLFNAQQGNGKPGLWVNARCKGWWATVPLVPRDAAHPEDIDTKTIDHWADTCRYACTYEVQEAKINSSGETLAKYGIGGPGVPSMF